MKNILRLSGLFALLLGITGVNVACDTDGKENEPTITVTAPSNPQVAEVGYSGATFSWSDVPEAATYEVELDDRLWEKNAPLTPMIVTDLAPETGYAWRVRALNKDGVASEWVEGSNFTTQTFAESSLQGLRVGTPGKTRTTIVWEPQKDATRYQVRFNDTEQYVAVEELSYLLTDLSPETTYTFEARAVKDEEAGQWTSVTFTTFGPSFWEYEDILGPYSAVGIPSALEEPGPGEWVGQIAMPIDGDMSYYVVTDSFATEDPIFVDVVNNGDGTAKFYYDDYSIVYDLMGLLQVVGEAIYLDDFSWVPWGEQAVELTWDGASKTFSFASQHDGRDIAVGHSVYMFGDYAGAGSDFYKDLVLTLDPVSGNVKVSGTRVAKENIKISGVVKRNTRPTIGRISSKLFEYEGVR